MDWWWPNCIFGTTNGGLIWKTPRFESSLYSLFPVTSFNFYSPQYGFATGGGHDIVGVIWRTKDFGATWLAVPVGPEPLQEIYFIDSLNIVGVGGDFEFGTGIAQSDDGGENWTYTEPGFLVLLLDFLLEQLTRLGDVWDLRKIYFL